MLPPFGLRLLRDASKRLTGAARTAWGTDTECPHWRADASIVASAERHRCSTASVARSYRQMGDRVGSGEDSWSDRGALRCGLRVARVRSSRRLDQKQVCLLLCARLMLDANRDDEQVARVEHDVTVT